MMELIEVLGLVVCAVGLSAYAFYHIRLKKK